MLVYTHAIALAALVAARYALAAPVPAYQPLSDRMPLWPSVVGRSALSQSAPRAALGDGQIAEYDSDDEIEDREDDDEDEEEDEDWEAALFAKHLAGLNHPHLDRRSRSTRRNIPKKSSPGKSHSRIKPSTAKKTKNGLVGAAEKAGSKAHARATGASDRRPTTRRTTHSLTSAGKKGAKPTRSGKRTATSAQSKGCQRFGRLQRRSGNSCGSGQSSASTPRQPLPQGNAHGTVHPPQGHQSGPTRSAGRSNQNRHHPYKNRGSKYRGHAQGSHLNHSGRPQHGHASSLASGSAHTAATASTHQGHHHQAQVASSQQSAAHSGPSASSTTAQGPSKAVGHATPLGSHRPPHPPHQPAPLNFNQQGLASQAVAPAAHASLLHGSAPKRKSKKKKYARLHDLERSHVKQGAPVDTAVHKIPQNIVHWHYVAGSTPESPKWKEYSADQVNKASQHYMTVLQADPHNLQGFYPKPHSGFRKNDADPTDPAKPGEVSYHFPIDTVKGSPHESRVVAHAPHGQAKTLTPTFHDHTKPAGILEDGFSQMAWYEKSS